MLCLRFVREKTFFFEVLNVSSIFLGCREIENFGHGKCHMEIWKVIWELCILVRFGVFSLFEV